MKRSIVFSTEALWPLVDVAREAERRGFHRVWTTETNTRDGLVRALMLANATSTIGVGTGIAYCFTRAPLAMAAEAADIHALSGGRLTLGLGFGTRGMRRNWYGLDLDHPASRFAEYVALLRAAWSAEDGLSFQGRFYSANVPGYRLDHPRDLLAGLPVYGSGLHGAMLRTAARTCDGIALHPLAARAHYLDDRLAELDRTVPLAAWRMTAVDDDGDLARARARAGIAFYFATPSYADVAQGRPWQERAALIATTYRAMVPHVDWSRLASLVDDDMIADLALAGTPAEVRAQLPGIEAELARRGVAELVFQTVGKAKDGADAVANCERIVAACAPT